MDEEKRFSNHTKRNKVGRHSANLTKILFFFVYANDRITYLNLLSDIHLNPTVKYKRQRKAEMH